MLSDSRLYRERDLQRQVNLVKGQLRDLRNSNDTQQAKLLDQSQRQGMN
jgi:homeobox protein cut-like